jgi:hypothetical protein
VVGGVTHRDTICATADFARFQTGATERPLICSLALRALSWHWHRHALAPAPDLATTWHLRLLVPIIFLKPTMGPTSWLF